MPARRRTSSTRSPRGASRASSRSGSGAFVPTGAAAPRQSGRLRLAATGVRAGILRRGVLAPVPGAVWAVAFVMVILLLSCGSARSRRALPSGKVSVPRVLSGRRYSMVFLLWGLRLVGLELRVLASPWWCCTASRLVSSECFYCSVSFSSCSPVLAFGPCDTMPPSARRTSQPWGAVRVCCRTRNGQCGVLHCGDSSGGEMKRFVFLSVLLMATFLQPMAAVAMRLPTSDVLGRLVWLGNQTTGSQGSGTLVRDSGVSYLVTAHHVYRGCNSNPSVRFGRLWNSFHWEVVASDESLDVIVLKSPQLSADLTGLPVLYGVPVGTVHGQIGYSLGFPGVYESGNRFRTDHILEADGRPHSDSYAGRHKPEYRTKAALQRFVHQCRFFGWRHRVLRHRKGEVDHSGRDHTFPCGAKTCVRSARQRHGTVHLAAQRTGWLCADVCGNENDRGCIGRVGVVVLLRRRPAQTSSLSKRFRSRRSARQSGISTPSNEKHIPALQVLWSIRYPAGCRA